MHGFNIFARKINNINNKSGKRRQVLHLTGKKGKLHTQLSLLTTSKVASLVLK